MNRTWLYLYAVLSAFGVVSGLMAILYPPNPLPPYPIAAIQVAQVGTPVFLILMVLFLWAYLKDCYDNTPPSNRAGPHMRRAFTTLVEYLRDTRNWMKSVRKDLADLFLTLTMFLAAALLFRQEQNSGLVAAFVLSFGIGVWIIVSEMESRLQRNGNH